MPWWRSFVFRFVGLFASTIALVLLVAIYWLHEVQAREVADKFGLALESIAGTAAPFVPGDDLDAVQTNADAAGPAFQRVRAVLERVRRENHLTEDAVYVLRPGRRQGTWEFAAMLQERTFIGDPYQPPPALSERYRWVWSHGDSVRTGLYTDAHGTFISGLAPVTDRAGRVVGILHIDYGIDRYLAEIDEQSRMLIGEGAALVLFIFAVGAWTHYRLRRKVLALLRGTSAIQSEDYDFRVDVAGRDELASVAAALNDVIRRLKERFEMLKFLPRHTASMIREATAQRDGHVSLDQAQRVRLVVFESDIRGFSSIAEHLSPEQTIGMLNRYIREQAEIVEAAGGSIDKYMGDAVLALFQGEDMERRALRCAVTIQSAVQRLNEEGAFVVPIHIGIGLSVGEVVMGNMGSERRMEHTVIGPTVNLAARLCAAAKADEIVVQKTLWDAAPDAVDAPATGMEEVRVKGFEQPIVCVRFMLGVATALAVLTGGACSQTSPATSGAPPEVARPYEEGVSAQAQIDAALAASRADGKRVMLVFGANWCSWCRRLEHTFQNEPSVVAELGQHFRIVHVDTGARRSGVNAAVVTRYGDPVQHGLPVIVVLAPDGSVATTQETGALEEGDRHSPAKILAFLRRAHG